MPLGQEAAGCLSNKQISSGIFAIAAEFHVVELFAS
jgi:hypothetical protein